MTEPQAVAQDGSPLGFFGRYLTIWVLLCIVAGTGLGVWLPDVVDALAKAKYAQISAPIAVLLWLMIYPMAVRVDFASLRRVRQQPRAVAIACFVNWAVQPFLMFALAIAFYRGIFRGALDSLEKRDEFVAGAVILGGSPCTAMVFVWSALVAGHPGYTLVQVAVNDLIIFILYTPTLLLLLQATVITIPYDTIVLSVVLFVAVPFAAGALTRHFALKQADGEQRLQHLLAKFEPVTIIALLLTLVLIFMFQGQQMVDKPVDLLIASTPLVLQTYIVFAIAFGLMYYFRVPFDVAAPGAFIAASNFFELGVGVAISAYGAESSATLVNVAGVLTEVPVMLSLVRVALALKHHFPEHHNGLRGTELAREDKRSAGAEARSLEAHEGPDATAVTPLHNAAADSHSHTDVTVGDVDVRAVHDVTGSSDHLGDRAHTQEGGEGVAASAHAVAEGDAPAAGAPLAAASPPNDDAAGEGGACLRAPSSVLFLCVGNSCRSQMAHGWAQHWAITHGRDLRVQSAGAAPTLLNSYAVAAMAEAGVDIAHHAPKRVSTLQGEPFDCVVTLCGAGDAQCPSYMVSGSSLHRPFEDPSHMGDGRDVAQYARVRDEIRAFVERLLEGKEPVREEDVLVGASEREGEGAAAQDEEQRLVQGV